MSKKSRVSSEGPAKSDPFTPPWPSWHDEVINRLDWNDIPPGEYTPGRGGSRRGSRKSISRKSLAKKSITGGKKKSIGGRKSMSRKSVSRKSVAGSRKSVSRKSVSRKSVSRKSVSRKPSRKSMSRKSVRRKSSRKSMKRKSMSRKSISKRRLTGLKRKKSTATSEDKVEEKEPFVDPSGRDFMPKSLEVHKWEKPSEHDPDIVYALDVEPGPLDLWSHNKHLADSKAMRLIISSLMCLENDGRNNPFLKDLECPSYVPNSGENWHPRDHVYAMTQAGDKSKHNPAINPYGMYIIRGKWRRIVVDEYFPYDESGNLLLPRSRDPKNIWMQLLTKALLKIASLSCNVVDETLDFNPISLLTGWICNSIDVSLLMEEPIWKIIQGHCIEGVHPEERICASVDPKTCIHDAVDVFLDKPKSRSVFIHLPEIPDTQSVFVPCFEGLAYVKTALNDLIPECEPKWKNYRWVDWALERGLIRGKPGTVRRILELFVPLKSGFHTFVEEKSEEKESVDMQRPSMIMQGQYKTDAYFYNRIYENFKRLDIYYKRKYFEYEKSMENIMVDLPKLEKNQNAQNTFRDHFYLASDSANCKNIFVTLTTLCEKTETSGYIACEGYRWRNNSQGPIWFSIRTRGTRTHSINLGPGLQICRFWYNLPCMNHITFHSRSQFYLTGKEEIINMQSVETTSYLEYGAQLADVFAKLMKAPLGSVKQGEFIGQFVGSLCPPNLRNQHLPTPADPEGLLNVGKLEELFEEKAIEILMENEPDPEKRFQIIKGYQDYFLDPEFGEKTLEKLDTPPCQEVLQKLKDTKQQTMEEFRAAKKAWTESFNKDDDKKKDKRRLSSKKSIRRGSSKKSIRRGSAKKSIRRGSSKKSIRRQSAKKSIRRGSSKKSIRRQSGSGRRRSSKGGRRRSSKGGRRRSSKGGRRRSSTKGSSKGKKKPDKDQKGSMYLLDSPSINASLLRKMLQHEQDLLEKYPFRYDNDKKLYYYDYVGVTDMDIAAYQDWIPFALMNVNIHNENFAPCGFYLYTEAKKSRLDMYDLDTNVQVPFEYDPNGLVNLKKNSNGYALVACRINEPEVKGVNWRIRVYGVDKESMPHICPKTKEKIESKPYLGGEKPKISCTGEAGANPILNLQSLTGIYFPNPNSKICKFLIKITKSTVVSLVFSASKKDVKVLLTLKGKNVVKITGEGEIAIPVLLLKFTEAEYQPSGDGLESFFYFLGEVDVMYDSWTPKGKEAAVLNEQKKWKEDELNEKVVEEQSSQSLQSNLSAREKRKASIAKAKLQPSIDGGPCWKISLYTDSLDAENVTIALDKRYEESFMKKKAAIWDVEDPNRTEIGNKLRQAFINDYVKDLLPKSQSKEISTQEVPVVAPQSRKKSSSTSRKSTKSGKKVAKSPSVVKVESVPEEPLVMPKLLPPLIEKFSLPLPLDVIPIVIELEPVPTSAPAHLGPFREDMPRNEVAGEDEIFGEEFQLERMPSPELFKSEMSQKIVEENQDAEYINLKQAGDAALQVAYEEREKAIREVMKAMEKENAKAKKGASKGKNSRRQSRRQSRRKSRKQSTKKSIRRQSAKRKSSKK